METLIPGKVVDVSTIVRPTSNDLLLAAGDGDQEAFALLFDRLVDPVRLLIRGFVTDEEALDEVTRTVMLETWRTAPTFDPAAGSASRSVLALARLHAASWTAAGRGVRVPTVRLGRRPAGGPPTSVVADAPAAEQLLQALAGLPAVHRHALQLAFHGQADYLEVARLLEISPGQILVAMRGGLRQLRSTLGSPSVEIAPPARVAHP